MDAARVLDDLLVLVPQKEQPRRKGSRSKVLYSALAKTQTIFLIAHSQNYAGRSVEAVATDMQLQFEKAVLDDKQLHELACKGRNNQIIQLYLSNNFSAKCRHQK